MRLVILKVLASLIIALTLHPSRGIAQALKEITIQPGTLSGTLNEFLPFDQEFMIKGEVPAETRKVVLKIKVWKKDFSKTDELSQKDSVLYSGIGSGKRTFSFVVKPLPPNREISLLLKVSTQLPGLKEFSETVTEQVHSFLTTTQTAGTSVSVADYKKIKEQLLALFKSKYSKYTLDTSRTILGEDKQMIAKFDTLLRDLVTRNNYLNTINGKINALKQPLQELRSITLVRDAYLHAQSLKRPDVAAYLAQLLSSTDDIGQALQMGLAGMDPDKPIGIVYTGTNSPLDLHIASTEIEFRAKQLHKSMEGFKALLTFMTIHGPTTLQATVLPTPANPVLVANYQKTLQQIQDALNKCFNLVSGQEAELVRLSTSTYYKTLKRFSSEFEVQLESSNNIYTTTNGNFETKGSWYISADFGLTYVPTLKKLSPSYGAIIYFTPVNKNARYRPSDIRRIYGADKFQNTLTWLGKHMGLSIGVTTSSFDDPAKDISGLWGSNNLLIGGGFRFGPAVRLSSGAMLFRGHPNGNYFDEQTIAATPYVGLTVDLDLVKFFGKLGGVLTK